MTTRHLISTLFTTLALAGCSQPTPEQQFINDAAAALGGRSRIEAVKTLTIEGEGVNYNLGQDVRPEAATQTFVVTGYQRQMDLEGGRQRVEQTRTPRFAYFQGPQAQKETRGLDDEVAFNVNAAGAVTRIAGPVANDRRFDFYHHPLVLVRAALDPKSTVTNLRTAGAERQADIVTAAGLTLTLTIDAAGQARSISSHAYHANLGDVDEYQEVDGHQLPARLSGRVDEFTTWEVRATSQAINAAVDDLQAPPSAGGSAGPPPPPPMPTVAVQAVGKGVWLLAGQTHHSVVVEFSDHLMLIDAPQSEARTLAVIAKARETVPGKPLTQLVTTHHHFDHTAGLRAAISEGLMVITQSGNRAWVEGMAARSHTLQPDALAAKPKPVTVEVVDSERTFKDPTMTLTLYHVAGNPHSDTMLMAYLPRDRVLIQVDAFSPGAQSHPYAANLLENIQSRKLRVDRIVPLHGAMAPMADLIKAGG